MNKYYKGIAKITQVKTQDGPEEEHQGHDEGSEVVVYVDCSLIIQLQVPKQLKHHRANIKLLHTSQSSQM